MRGRSVPLIVAVSARSGARLHARSIERGLSACSRSRTRTGKFFATLRPRSSTPGGEIFSALDGDTPIGTAAAVRVSAERYELAKMAVEPAHQGRGIGQRLGEAVIQWTAVSGAQTLFLLTNSSLAGAIRLYERLGFTHQPLPPGNGVSRADVHMELGLRPVSDLQRAAIRPGVS